MRILLPTLYDTHGGSTRVLLAAAAALRSRHEVRVRAPIPEADDRVPPDLPAEPLATRRAKLAVLPRLARLVLREAAALRAFRPDVVYVHDEPSLYVYGLAARCLRVRPTLVWHLHMRPGSGPTRLLREALADHRVVIARHAAGESRLPTTRLRNPLPSSGPAAPRSVGTIAVVGALSPRKNQALAIDAVALLRRDGGREGLTLIGPSLDPAYAAALRERARPLGDGVRFAGERPADAVWDGIGLALFPALLENQPLALAEALAAGIPVVATDIPAHREMIEEAGGDPACLAAPDPASVAAALRHARAHPPDPGLAARVRALYAPGRFADGVLALMREVEDRRRGAAPARDATAPPSP